MTPRWYRTRWFWVGLLGLILWVAAWLATYAGNKGHVWSYTGTQGYGNLSCGAGWIGIGTGKSMAGLPSLRKPKGLSHSAWDHSLRNTDHWLPPVQFEINQAQAKLWSHCSTWIAIWLIVWLVPLIAWHRPRRVRPPRLPGTPRRWFTSPILWAGLPGLIILLTLWIDSSGHRTFASWKWSIERHVTPNYFGFGFESNRGNITTWAGRPADFGIFSSQKTGLKGDRIKSSGNFTHLPDARNRKGARTLHTTYLTLTTLYLLLWALAAFIRTRTPAGK